MAELKNVFSWSKSRDELLRECPRKYYYDKYASWGGWDERSAQKTRLCYILKNLKNRWAWKGETVHHQIENVLKSMRAGSGVLLEQAMEQLTQAMRADYKSSKAKLYYRQPKKTVGLFEHEYTKPVSDAVWKEFHDGAADCLKHFFHSTLYAELEKEDKSQWLVIEDLEEFDFESSKVFVKLDFARKKDDKIEIYDWKTGKDNAEAAAVQIGCYAIYAMQKWSVPLQDIRAFLFNLATPNPVAKEQPLNAALIEQTQAAMRVSIRQMKAFLADPAKNIPVPEQNFPFAENERLCGFCAFYKVCEKWNPVLR